MEKITLAPLAPLANYNNGQNAERRLRYTLTGEIVKADNKPAEESADCLDIQIKSNKASVCKGSDLDSYLASDKANRYAYVMSDNESAVIMSKTEWKAFVKAFGYITRESAKNGGKEKIRLKAESAKMREWLARA